MHLIPTEYKSEEKNQSVLPKKKNVFIFCKTQ